MTALDYRADAAETMLELLQRIDAKIDDLHCLIAKQRKELLTVEEFATQVGRSPYTVRRWVNEGTIAATRVMGTGPRGRLLIDRKELGKMVEAGRGGQVVATAVG